MRMLTVIWVISTSLLLSAVYGGRLSPVDPPWDRDEAFTALSVSDRPDPVEAARLSGLAVAVGECSSRAAAWSDSGLTLFMSRADRLNGMEDKFAQCVSAHLSETSTHYAARARAFAAELEAASIVIPEQWRGQSRDLTALRRE